MGKPRMVNPYDSDVKLRERTLGSETSQYQEEKRKIIYSRSSGERNGKSPNRPHHTACDAEARI